jgi:hypothetical protein
MNGAIIGNFNTTNSLNLITTNSPVFVRVGAENEESQKPTEVVIQTDNAFVAVPLISSLFLSFPIDLSKPI